MTRPGGFIGGFRSSSNAATSPSGSGGGNHKGTTCLNLVQDGKVVQSATGQNQNQMALAYFDVQTLVGQEAHFEIVDEQKGGWGNVGVGRITFTDKFEPPIPFEELPDLGTMGLALLGTPADIVSGDAHRAIGEKLMGELGRKFTLASGQSAVVTFVLTWHFQNLTIKGVRKRGDSMPQSLPMLPPSPNLSPRTSSGSPASPVCGATCGMTRRCRMVPRSDATQHLDSRDLHVLPVGVGPLLGLGGRRLL